MNSRMITGLTSAGLICSAVCAQSITCIGTFPNGGQSWASALSGDGTFVVGGAEAFPGANRAFRWSVGGMVSLGALGAHSSEAKAVSQNGSVVVGESGARAFRWTSEDGMLDLGVLPGHSYGSASAVSANGAVVVGRSYIDSNFTAKAFRWSAADGMVALDSLPGGNRSEANGVSADGNVIVGFSGVDSSSKVVACRWVPTGTMSLGFAEGAAGSWATSTNENGSVIVGLNYFDSWSRPQSAFRWSAQGGMQDLGTLFSGYKSYSTASGVSADGLIVVGGSGIWGESRIPYIWHSSVGMVSLENYLLSRGVDLSGWSSFWGDLSISADGRHVAGSGMYEGQWRAFVADIGVIPAPGTLAALALVFIRSRRRRD